MACDAEQAVLEPLAATGVRTTTAWDRALDPAAVDAAVITLPHHLYPDVVNAALGRGIHVLKEKPFARDLEDARTMLAAAEKSSATLMVAGQGKYSAGYQRAKQIAAGGVLGQVFLARGVITYRWGGAVHDNWRWRGSGPSPAASRSSIPAGTSSTSSLGSEEFRRRSTAPWARVTRSRATMMWTTAPC